MTLRYAIKRIIGWIPTLFLISIFVFLFVHFIPGDPARLVAGQDATLEDIARVEKELGLDQPIHVQYINFISGIFHGDFGTSLKTGRPVIDEIGQRFMPTFWLTIWSMVWSVIIGLVIGIISAT
ncbi:MAG: glutathione ABC transporter permease GsiC, partial [Bacillus sp. (in: Bacteria)]|nr:glutathione ABC transporter permease GsiC [Bacillus sp. (in: firmicutes)]